MIIQVTKVVCQNHSFMSINIRYDNPDDGINTWDKRKLDLANLISNYHPDIIGTQEGLYHQLSYLNGYLQDYSMIGVGRDDGKNKGEFTSIYYDTLKYNCLKSETFWLSKTPEKVSVGWDAALERICTYGLFKNINSLEEIYVFNTHFDHMGSKARKKSAKLIIDFISKLSDESKIILMGDLNSIPESKPIKIITKYLADGASSLKNDSLEPIGTFNGFDEYMVLDKRIDYIFVKNVDIISYKHMVDRRVDGGFISDHLPVIIEVSY